MKLLLISIAVLLQFVGSTTTSSTTAGQSKDRIQPFVRSINNSGNKTEATDRNFITGEGKQLRNQQQHAPDEIMEVDSSGNKANLVNLYRNKLQQQGDENWNPTNGTGEHRQRRLIPYMTFYIPTGTSSNQFYLGNGGTPNNNNNLNQHQTKLSPAGTQLQTTKLQQQPIQLQRHNSKIIAQPFPKPKNNPSVIIISGGQSQLSSSPQQQQQQHYRPIYQSSPKYEPLTGRRPLPFAVPQKYPSTKLRPQSGPFPQIPVVVYAGGTGGGARAQSLTNQHQPFVRPLDDTASNNLPLNGESPTNENRHHNLLTSPEFVSQHQQQQQSSYADSVNPGHITPFLPSNKLPGRFKPMVSSQTVAHVPAEIFQEYDDTPQNYQYVTSTEKPIKYKYELYQPQVISTEKPVYSNYEYSNHKPQPVYNHLVSTTEAGGVQQSDQEDENELEERRNYYENLKYYHLQHKQQLLQQQQQHQEQQQHYQEPQQHHQEHQQYQNEHKFHIPITTARPVSTTSLPPTKRPNRPIFIISTAKPKQKYSSSYRAGGGFLRPSSPVTDQASSTTTPSPFKSYVSPNQQHLKTINYFPPTTAERPKEKPVYLVSTYAPPLQHLTETSHLDSSRLTTYHPRIQYVNPQYQYETYEPENEYYYNDPKQLVATTPAPPPEPLPSPAPITPTSSHSQDPFTYDENNSLSQILKKLQDSNHLPKTLTPDNIDNSIKTLIKILNNLKRAQSIHNSANHLQQTHDEDYNNLQDDYYDQPGVVNEQTHVDQLLGSNSGTPGVDYPIYSEIPQTAFNCKEQRYKGFFGDPETNCQVWHYCDLNGGQASFLCPNGTIFSQVALTCDWWFNVKCSTTAQLYVLNERLYKYILPFTPKFPEDYSGPLVDKYLAIKFQEMEEKMRKQKGKKVHEAEDEDEEEIDEFGNVSGIDEAVQKDDEDELDDGNAITTTLDPIKTQTTVIDSSEVTENSIYHQPTASPLRAVPSVEIKSDGNTGHLMPHLHH